MTALAMSVDLSWSPAPYWVSTIVMFGILGLDLIGEALHAIDAGAAGLVVGDDRHFAGTADQLGHMVGRRRRRRDVVRRRGGHRDVAVHAGVEADHRDVGGLGLLEQRGEALESTAARQMAAGFLSSAVWNISTCLSTIASVSGPSKVMSTLNSFAAFSEPAFTACQNWCWNPLEMTGMYGLALRAAGCAAGAWCGAAAGCAGGKHRDDEQQGHDQRTVSCDISDSSLQGYVMSAPRGASQLMKSRYFTDSDRCRRRVSQSSRFVVRRRLLLSA